MALLGEVRVNGTYDGRKMDKGFAKSKKGATLFQKSLKGLTGAVGLLGGAFAAFKLVGFANNQRALIDDLAKTSRRLGLTTEALGAYQHAADLSGLSSGQLTTALEKMRDTIGAANLGEGTAIKAFEAIGLSVKEITAAEDPLVKIQQAISRIGDQNTKIAIVRDIFGRSGAQALNLFEQNLAGVRKEYEQMGLAISSEEAKRIEDFNDSLTTLSTRFTGLGRRLLIDITDPAIEAVKGLTVILEETGILKPGQTAFEKVRGRRQTAGAISAQALGGAAILPGAGIGRRQVIDALGEFFAFAGQTTQERATTISSDKTIQRRQLRVMEETREAIRNQQNVVVEPANL